MWPAPSRSVAQQTRPFFHGAYDPAEETDWLENVVVDL